LGHRPFAPVIVPTTLATTNRSCHVYYPFGLTL
jgi:hypothetical protein